MNMVHAYVHPPARDHSTIVPFGVVQNINGTILALTSVDAVFRPFHLAEKWNDVWNGVERVRRSAGGDQLTANSDKLIAGPKFTVVSSFMRAILTIDAVQNTNGVIHGLIPPDTTFRARHLAEKVARAVARWPFSMVQNTNGHFSGLSYCITLFSPGHLVEKVASQIRAAVSKSKGGPFSGPNWSRVETIPGICRKASWQPAENGRCGRFGRKTPSYRKDRCAQDAGAPNKSGSVNKVLIL